MGYDGTSTNDAVVIKIGHNHAVGAYPDIPGNLDFLKSL
jgi:hypothetical protein